MCCIHLITDAYLLCQELLGCFIDIAEQKQKKKKKSGCDLDNYPQRLGLFPSPEPHPLGVLGRYWNL